MSFSTPPLQAETPAIPVPRSLQGLYCRKIEGENFIEIAACGNCSECGKPGFFNHRRIQAPQGLELYAETRVLRQVEVVESTLEPRLSPGGPTANSRLCPPCKLAWLDPTTFVKENSYVE